MNADVARHREFEAIYDAHLHSVFAYALRQVGRREIAEEITGDAFLRLYERWPEVDREGVPAWLFTVTRNLAMDYWRRNSVQQRHAQQAAPAEVQPEPESRAVESWILNEPGLKPAHRACLLLRYVHDMNRSEIATRLGLTENQVKSNLQYALTLLRKAFASGGA